MKRVFPFEDSEKEHPARKHPRHDAMLSIVEHIVILLIVLQAINQLNEFCLHYSFLEDQIMKSVNWHEFSASISDKHFRRMFRMNKRCFQKLCDRIEYRVGRKQFKSQDYITSDLENGNTREGIMYRAQKHTSGGYICGEVKLALTLRLLAGGSYLDIGQVFDVQNNHPYKIFHDVLKNWICHDSISKYRLKEIINNPKEMYEVSKHFAEGRSGGIMGGTIGALDGWLVKIQCPSLKRDGVRNPGGYFSCKGFYALNVQVIVDKKKRVLSMFLGAKGGEHDSAAFKSSSMYSLLEANYLDPEGKLHNNEYGIPFHIIGDSAYSLRPFLLVPYDNAKTDTSEDTYNYIHSSSRIVVECAFGEIDSRWGIFWRPLRFKLSEHRVIIDACMRLHNFIIDYKEETDDHEDSDDYFSEECLGFITANPNEIVGTFGNGEFGDDVAETRRGRPTNMDVKMREAGVTLRNQMKEKMKQMKFMRPKASNNWYRDKCNHTKMTT